MYKVAFLATTLFITLFERSIAAIRAPEAFVKLLKQNVNLTGVPGTYVMGSNQISNLKITGTDFRDVYLDSLRNEDMSITITGLQFSVMFRYSVAQRTPLFIYRDHGSGSGTGGGGVRLIFGSGNQVWCDASQLEFQLQLFSERSRLRSFLTNAYIHIRQKHITETLQSSLCYKAREEIAKMLSNSQDTPVVPFLFERFSPFDDVSGYLTALTDVVDKKLIKKYKEYDLEPQPEKIRAIFQRSVSHVLKNLGKSVEETAEVYGDIGMVIVPISKMFYTLSQLLNSRAEKNDAESLQYSKELVKNLEEIGLAYSGLNIVLPKYVGKLVAKNFNKSEFETTNEILPLINVLEELGEQFADKGEGTGLLKKIGYEVVTGINNKMNDINDDEPVADDAWE